MTYGKNNDICGFNFETLNLQKQEPVSEEVKELLSQSHACYVLITCTKPSEDGKMEVEMTYEGDPSLAAYLIESAQSFI